jgi:hypothetical protein
MPKVNVGMDLAVTLPNFEREFETQAFQEIRKIINDRAPIIVGNLETELGFLLDDLIKDSPEYQSLASNGQLRGELGLPSIDLIDDIIDVWIDGIDVAYLPDRELGEIAIVMIDSDYSDVLASPSATFSYFSRNPEFNRVIQIDWLRWLLLEGRNLVISKYRFIPRSRGRTGLGIMIKSSSSGYKVPKEFSGTATNNFVTRSLKGIRGKINNLIEIQIDRAF